MTTPVVRTVLFADLRGSTSLYETLGNAEATAVVTQSVALLAQVVINCNGRVIKTLGDGLMALFEHAQQGLQAADEMHESLERIASLPSVPGRAPALKLQVALALGEVIELAGDCFGDAVNVAARLLDHAGDNETLVTGNVLANADGSQLGRVRRLDRMQLRGRLEPVEVHRMEGRRFNDTQVTAFQDVPPVMVPDGIRLVWLDLNRVFAGASLPVILGRSSQATYCVDDSRVSRSHARIEWHGGNFQLTDLSYNGTYVRYGNQADIVALKRSTCVLHGRGLIGLGASPADASAPCVRFEVLSFSDTVPHVP
ncbi:MAG TPA: adenylate/guanylate cyclase domain-containing protein [Methylibium sp.]